MVIALAAAAASLSEHPSTAAILVLAITVGTWVLGFVAAFSGGIWEQIAAYTQIDCTPCAKAKKVQTRGITWADVR